MGCAGRMGLQWGGFYKGWPTARLSKSCLKFGLAAIVGSLVGDLAGDPPLLSGTIERHPANAPLLRYLARKTAHSRVEMFDPGRRAGESDYWSGSDPEIVERVWGRLGRERIAGRCLVAGNPALADPASGDRPGVRLRDQLHRSNPSRGDGEATQLGYESSRQFTARTRVDLATEVEPSWVFGRWLDFEFDWLRLVAASDSRCEIAPPERAERSPRAGR